MDNTDKLLVGLLVLIAVGAFFALVAYLGGYGAIIAACIIAGLANLSIEETTKQQ